MNDAAEWLEPDGRGGYASGTACGLRTRRYHALLLCATRPPTGRMVLVNGMEAWVETPGGRQALTRQRYAPDVVAPREAAGMLRFDVHPWPTWRLRLDDGRVVRAECFVDKQSACTVLRWELETATLAQARVARADEGTGRDMRGDTGAVAAPREGAAGVTPLTLKVRLLLSGRDYHALHHENPAFDFSAHIDGPRVRWRPYGAVPAITALANGRYTHEPDWYRNFRYARESERGLDDVEDLATPGVFAFDLGAAPAVMILAAGDGGVPLEDSVQCVSAEASDGLTPSAQGASADATGGDREGPGESVAYPERSGAYPNRCGPYDAERLAARFAARERTRRAAFPDRLRRAADAYVVARAGGLTLMAGYPWFTDWGRDTFIAMRGLLLATGRLDEARAILLQWTRYISQGMLPNHFPDDGGEPAYNSVDASLWFIVAAHDYMATGHADPSTQARLRDAIEAIVAGYAAGTRHGIRADDDGLLSAGCPGMQLTWMDAKIGDWVVTPRIGKPVEVQALWINALRIAGADAPAQPDLAADARDPCPAQAGRALPAPATGLAWRALAARATEAFLRRFAKPDGSGLYDVVDVDHEAGRLDGSVRPNQLFAVGGLPYAVVEGPLARSIVAQVERELLTPLGPRTLAPGDPAYIGRYQGGPRQRDGAYHQGTVWPWLMGPFLQAWLRTRAEAGTLDRAALDEARARWLAPLYRHLEENGLDHVSEVADGDAPHTCGGAPFQAWSLGELLRMEAMLASARKLDAGAVPTQ